MIDSPFLHNVHHGHYTPSSSSLTRSPHQPTHSFSVMSMPTMSLPPVPPHHLSQYPTSIPNTARSSASESESHHFAYTPPRPASTSPPNSSPPQPQSLSSYQNHISPTESAFFHNAFDSLQHQRPYATQSQSPTMPTSNVASTQALSYPNANAYAPYAQPRRSPPSHASNASPPGQHHQRYNSAGSVDTYAATAASFQDTHSPSVSPPSVSVPFDAASSYSSYVYAQPTAHTLPPPPLYTSAHPHPPPPSATQQSSASFPLSNSQSHDSFRPRQNNVALSSANRYHPYASAAAAASGTPTATPTQKPYACRMCTYTSSRSHDLKRHLRTHTNERPYECEVCHRNFARKDAAKRHMAAKNCGANESGKGGQAGATGSTSNAHAASGSRADEDGRSRSGSGSASMSPSISQPAPSPSPSERTPTPISASDDRDPLGRAASYPYPQVPARPLASAADRTPVERLIDARPPGPTHSRST